MSANPISGPYNVAVVAYHQPNATTFTRTIRVTATTNNPLTLTGSYANNTGFLIMNTGSVILSASNGTGYIGADFHETNQNHQIFSIGLSYVSASAGGDITVLYNY
jgi:glutaredoxin-related protein